MAEEKEVKKLYTAHAEIKIDYCKGEAMGGHCAYGKRGNTCDKSCEVTVKVTSEEFYKVIMLEQRTLPPTIPFLGLNTGSDKLYYLSSPLIKTGGTLKAQHLYVVSEMLPIKEGDWYIVLRDKELHRHVGTGLPFAGAAKVVASTDDDLEGCLLLTDEFAKSYAEAYSMRKPITEVPSNPNKFPVEKFVKERELKRKLAALINASFTNFAESEDTLKHCLLTDMLELLTARIEVTDGEAKALSFVFNRMKEHHGENENYDYMINFKSVLNKLKQI